MVRKFLTFIKAIFTLLAMFLAAPFLIMWDLVNPKYNAPLSRRLKATIGGLGAWFLTLIILPFIPFILILMILKKEPISSRIWTNTKLFFNNAEDVCNVLVHCLNEKDNSELAEEWWYFLDAFAGILHLDNDLYEMGNEYSLLIQKFEPGASPFNNEKYAEETKIFVEKWRAKLNEPKTQALP